MPDTLCRGAAMVDEKAYSVFDMEREVAPFETFPDGLKVGQRAPDFESLGQPALGHRPIPNIKYK